MDSSNVSELTIMAKPLAEEFDSEEPVIEAIRGGDRYAEHVPFVVEG